MLLRAAILILLVSIAGSLSAQSDDFGKWVTLFDGKSMAGWVNAKAKAGAPVEWKVDDGAITNGKDGGHDLCSASEFDDYELEIEYKIKKGGNSGVYLRGRIEVQIFDSAGKAKLEPVDAGAIYAVGPALVNAAKPAGEWNLFRIVHLGHRITAYHNGKLIQDNVYRDTNTPGQIDVNPATGRDLRDNRKGPVMLQGDHGHVWYRNIRARPCVQRGDGWRPLWNGKDVSEFTARGDGRAKDGLRWGVDNHAFTTTKWGGDGHDIWTNESFGNFLVHYEYRSDPKAEGGNAGFYLRDQWEIQIFKETTTDNHTDACLYSKIGVKTPARNGPEQWNHMDVKVDGMKIWVWQNGKLLHDGVTLDTRTDNHGVKTPAFSKAPFKLQGDHGRVWFTNLHIKPLPDSK